MKIVILNGPPRSGKDTVGDYIIESSIRENKTNWHKLAFASWIKDQVAFMLGLPDPIDAYDKDKYEVEGMTLREWLIDFAENYVKPRLGKGYAGAKVASNLLDILDFYGEGCNFIITDLGFNEELEVFIRGLGPVLEDQNTEIIVVNLFRPEKTFEGDSRNYITPKDTAILATKYGLNTGGAKMTHRSLVNFGDIPELFLKANNVIDGIYSREVAYD